MKQLLILSGKGGTGKTTVAAAFTDLSRARAIADCDVDAPNLHLVLHFKDAELSDYYGFKKAVIDSDRCIKCGLCEERCAFDAIRNFTVGEYECEGCGVCAEICPVSAIEMREHVSGDMMLYRKDSRVFSTAELRMGSGASGKLVSEVKKKLLDEQTNAEFAIIDGSPGIGCPVIASISGADFVLIVAEPSISGIHDMKRIIDTSKHFGVDCAVCINKHDVNTELSGEIEKYCAGLSIPVLGKIPFDKTVINAVNSLKSIVRYPESPAGKAVTALWGTIYDNYIKTDKGEYKK